MSGSSSSFDLTKLIGFNFDGLQVDNVQIDNADLFDSAPTDYVPSSTTYNVLGNNAATLYGSAASSGFVSNDSDASPSGAEPTIVYEKVAAAANGTNIDGTPLDNPLALGQIAIQQTYGVTGNMPSPITYDVLGYSTDGKSILVGLPPTVVNLGTSTDPYNGAYYILTTESGDIDGDAAGTKGALFFSNTQTFTTTNTYTGGPASSGGTGADLATVTQMIVSLGTIPANLTTVPEGSGGTVQNANGTFTVLSTAGLAAYGPGTFTIDTNTTAEGTGAETQGVLKLTAESGTLVQYYQVVGFTGSLGSTLGGNVLLESVTAKGAQLGSPPVYSILTLPGGTAPISPGNANLTFYQGGPSPFLSATAPCFLRGTRISTPDGYKAVEMLQDGDLVLTATGDAVPVVWVGRARIDANRHREPRRVLPVRICAEALAPNVPFCDLFLSPDHAVFVDGLLIPVRELINRTTIQQVARRVIEYYHIELAQHDIILAENLTVESYLDTCNRGLLQGADLVAGGFDQAERNYMIWETHACCPLTVSGAKLRAVRERLNARANLLKLVSAA